MPVQNLDEIIKRIREEQGLPKGGLPPPEMVAPPAVYPKASQEITPYLAEKFGLEQVPAALRKLAEAGHDTLCPANMNRVTIGSATCGQLVGADYYGGKLKQFADFKNKCLVREVGCIGACFAEPLVDVRSADGTHYFYGQIDSFNYWWMIRAAKGKAPERTWAIFKEKQIGILTDFSDLELISSQHEGIEAFLMGQNRRVSGHCGLIDPESLEEYAATGGFFVFCRELFQRRPERIRSEIEQAGLRGRGGGGFPTHQKLALAASSDDPLRFVIANGDEGDPGAYMDRALLESDPYRVLEGIMLAALSVGAHRAYVFIRHEYPLAVERLHKAIESLENAGLLGENILDSNYAMHIEIVQSGGAFVCGEEMSMLQVMEGSRGTPQPRPPYPAEEGIYEHPTVISNVETYANIPWIMGHGAAAFREEGTEASTGTKILCLTGDIPRTGFIEVGFGVDSKTVVETIGGAKTAKAIQIGGPSGGILPYGDFAIDYDTVTATGAMVGSGGLVVLGDHRCMVDLARHLADFMAGESCGQCLMCRDGLAALEYRLARLTEGEGYHGILEEIESLAISIRDTSLCGLGSTAANPILTTLRYFRDEYEAHLDNRCPGLTCKALIRFEVWLNACQSQTCRICYTVCPSDAVTLRTGNADRVFLDNDKCTRCWACAEICPGGCIRAVTGADRYE